MGVDDEYEFNIDEYMREKVNSLEKWTLIEKKHSEIDLGNIYVLSNKSLPNTFKVGFTSKNPDFRAKSLGSSFKESSEFVIEKSWITKNPFEVEQRFLFFSRLQTKNLSFSNVQKEYFLLLKDTYKN